MTLLPFTPAHRLAEQPPERRWLVEGLWADQAVGILGGEPKCCKSFLALDLAVAVASGGRCLDRFPVRRKGRVLLFAAEDALHIVRERLQGIALARQRSLEALDIQVITAPSVRLDLDLDRGALEQTVAHLRPTLLVLDPFVRLHRVDENVSGDVAPLLAFLRGLQRRYQLCVLVVHHAKKGGGRLRAGQALRGSSEFHAWGDSNLYLRRRGQDGILLTVEHRSAPSMDPLLLALDATGAGLSLRLRDEEPIEVQASCRSPIEVIRRALADARRPIPRRELRASCRMRSSTFSDGLRALIDRGEATRTADGYQLASD